MSNWLVAYLPFADTICVVCGLAFSQYIALRAGVFSLATPAFASVGAYGGAILLKRYGFHPVVGLLVAIGIGGIGGLLLSIPLARLRGAFQAMATVGFVEIVIAMTLHLESLTGGALGINGIPKVIYTPHLLIFVLAAAAFLVMINATSIGRAFDAIRQDETVAESLGIFVARYHALAFSISGAIGALAGCLLAFNTYSLIPDQFAFNMLVLCLASVVLGGQMSVFGPILGSILLVLIPEFARPLAESRYVLHGVLPIMVIIYMPLGVVDTIKYHWRLRITAQGIRKHQVSLKK